MRKRSSPNPESLRAVPREFPKATKGNVYELRRPESAADRKGRAVTQEDSDQKQIDAVRQQLLEAAFFDSAPEGDGKDQVHEPVQTLEELQADADRSQMQWEETETEEQLLKDSLDEIDTLLSEDAEFLKDAADDLKHATRERSALEKIIMELKDKSPLNEGEAEELESLPGALVDLDKRIAASKRFRTKVEKQIITLQEKAQQKGADLAAVTDSVEFQRLENNVNQRALKQAQKKAGGFGLWDRLKTFVRGDETKKRISGLENRLKRFILEEDELPVEDSADIKPEAPKEKKPLKKAA